jgi:AraC family transcriptional regulator, arabinose operon regulatory protein
MRSGFPGERISVLPRPRVAQALEHPVTSRLVVTDCGYFPKAAGHLRSRPLGCSETIVIVCADGLGWCELSSGSHVVRPGQVLVVLSGDEHVYGADADSPWTIWWMHLAGFDVPALVQASGIGTAAPVLSLGHLPQAVSLVEEALLAMEHDDSQLTLQVAAGAAWHLMALLSTARPGLFVGRSDPVRVAIAYLQRQFAGKVSVGELADMVGLSPSHFSTLFRATAGCGPREYQTRLRMMKGRQLLDTTDLPVSTIARSVGYEDPLYFSRKFRAVHGMTASEHRARAKG